MSEGLGWDACSTSPQKETEENGSEASLTPPLENPRKDNHTEKNKNYSDEYETIPFTPEWAFGTRTGGRVVNLSYGGRGLIAFTGAHAVILYDYKTHSQRILLGHRNRVIAAASDLQGRWLVTACCGKLLGPCKVIVWSVALCCLARDLPGPQPDQGYSLLDMSPDGKYVVAVVAGTRKQNLRFWCWQSMETTGPDAEIALPEDLGEAQSVKFSQDTPEFFMVTCEKTAVFLSWENGALHPHVAELTRSAGRLVDSTYQRGTPNAISVSTRGFVVMWKDPPVYAPNCKVSRKVMCIDRCSLTTVTEVDKMAVIGNCRGYVRFYDQEMCILHWYQQGEHDPICSLSFSLDHPDSDLTWAESRTSFPIVSGLEVEHHGIQEELPLSRMTCGPSCHFADDITGEAGRFRARDLVVHTKSGRTAVVSFALGRCVYLQERQNNITVIQSHPEKPLILIGRTDGTISLIDTATKEVMINYSLIKKGQDAVPITSLKFSPNGLILACGMQDGTLHILHPELLKPVLPKPFRKTQSAIHSICFSANGRHLAHSVSAKTATQGRRHVTVLPSANLAAGVMCRRGDPIASANNVSAYRCRDLANQLWTYLGQQQCHGQPVRYLLFGTQGANPPLYSIGEDRTLVQYDVARSVNNSLMVTLLDRVEQSAVPRFMTWSPGCVTLEPEERTYLLLATSEFKFKLFDTFTKRIACTTQAPTLPTPINVIKTLGSAHGKDPIPAVFTTERYMGIQILPPDGDPYKHAAMIGHPEKIANFAISGDLKHVFSIGLGDQIVLMWRINEKCIESLKKGGEGKGHRGLEPWLQLLNGGKDGWLFNEMQDAFCYAQVLHQGVNSQEPRTVSDRLPLCEVPDLMRALGYFPSLFEIDNLFYEAEHRYGHSVSFQEFVKLYVNHTSANGFRISRLRNAFLTYGYEADNGEIHMTKDRFLTILFEKGEPFEKEEGQDIFRALLGDNVIDAGEIADEASLELLDERTKREKVFNYLPDTITFSYFAETLLGIVMRHRQDA